MVMDCRSKKSVVRIARLRPGSGWDGMGGRGGRMLAGSPGTGSSGHQPGNLVVLGGLPAADMPPANQRPFLVFCKYLSCTPRDATWPSSPAQERRLGATSGAPQLGDTCSWPHFSTLPKVSTQGIRGILRPVNWSCTQCGPLPAQSQLPVLKQCHCHQLALIRTWSTQFLEPTAETCNNNTPCGLTAWQHWQDRHSTALQSCPFPRPPTRTCL